MDVKKVGFRSISGKLVYDRTHPIYYHLVSDSRYSWMINGARRHSALQQDFGCYRRLAVSANYCRVLMNMAPRIFLSNETTTVKIGGVGKLTVKPFEESYDFTPGH